MKKGILEKIAWCILLFAVVLNSCTHVAATPVAMQTGGTATDRVTRVLVLGCDRAASLADTIMLVSVDATEKNAHILQIPRDTYAEYTEKNYKKLNGALSALGMDGFVSFLEETLGVPIDCYVKLKIDALVSVVDAIGGVDIVVPVEMHYTDPAQGLCIDLPAGPRHLTGAEAEQFVRYRAGYANADLGRLDAQKLFLTAFAKQCKSLSISQMLRAALHALTTVQTDIAIHQAVRLCSVLRDCDTEAIPMETLPGGAIRSMSGAWYYAVNREGGERAVREHLKIRGGRFDPRGVLDREADPSFHAIYTAREAALDELLIRLQN